jgi:hypothetical protein
MAQSPIYLKYYDLMTWLIPCTLNFPKSQRGVLARQLQSELFRTYEALVNAGKQIHPLNSLSDVDAGLVRLRTYLHLCRDLGLLSVSQYEHVSKIVGEVGRLLGGWIKTAANKE